MRIHSSVLTENDIREAIHAGGMTAVSFTKLECKGSRKRNHAFEVGLSGSSRYNTNPGNGSSQRPKAAAWDEWGIFIHALFVKDPSAIIGDYNGDDEFEYRTMGRFDNLTAPFIHVDHKWEFSGVARMFECDCGARRNY